MPNSTYFLNNIKINFADPERTWQIIRQEMDCEGGVEERIILDELTLEEAKEEMKKWLKGVSP